MGNKQSESQKTTDRDSQNLRDEEYQRYLKEVSANEDYERKKRNEKYQKMVEDAKKRYGIS